MKLVLSQQYNYVKSCYKFN